MLEAWENQETILYHQSLPYIPEIVKHKVISRYHNNLLVDYFGIKKAKELRVRNYF